MTTEQLLSLNINLKPNKLSDIKELETNHDVRNKLVYFFYQLKKNYDNYQKDLNICPVKITWDIDDTYSKTNVLNFKTNYVIQGVLSVKLYKHIFTEINKSYFINYIIEAVRLDNLFKKQSYHYFKGKICCDVKKISNYNQYYFMQYTKFIGNK